MSVTAIESTCDQKQILPVDYDATSVKLAERALRQSRILNHIKVARDGIEAMQLLQRDTKHSEAPQTELMPLDLDMPRMDGREVMSAIKSDPGLSSNPAIIRTTSSEEQDVARSYAGHANSYIVKPMDFVQLQQSVLAVLDYWFSLVKLPPK